MNELQRHAHLVFWYESEVQNGGHLQFFENHGTARLHEFIGSLRQLGATCQAEVLALAGQRWLADERARIRSVEEYVEVAMEGEFDSFDRAFHDCRLSLIEVLERYLWQHQSEFVVFSD